MINQKLHLVLVQHSRETGFIRGDLTGTGANQRNFEIDFGTNLKRGLLESEKSFKNSQK